MDKESSVRVIDYNILINDPATYHANKINVQNLQLRDRSSEGFCRFMWNVSLNEV